MLLQKCDSGKLELFPLCIQTEGTLAEMSVYQLIFFTFFICPFLCVYLWSLSIKVIEIELLFTVLGLWLIFTTVFILHSPICHGNSRLSVTDDEDIEKSEERAIDSVGAEWVVLTMKTFSHLPSRWRFENFFFLSYQILKKQSNPNH